MLEAQLNVECDKLYKEAVKGSMTRELRDKRQQLPLETVCMFKAERKQTSDPKKDHKRQSGTVQANAYYTSRGKRKDGMNMEVVDMIAWDDTEAALKGMSTMSNVWHTKQGSGFCGVI